MRSICTSIVATLLLAGMAYSQPVQWTFADGGNGHWYEAIEVEGGFLWEEARSRAEELGGYLVSLTSAEEDNWVYGNLGGYSQWIGAYQDTSAKDYSEPAGGWRWLSGEPWKYTNWNGGTPDNGGASDPEEEVADYCCGGAWNDIYEMDNFGVPTRKQIIVEWDNMLPIQWRIEDGGNGHWYVLDTYRHCSHEEAQAAAEAAGGHLVTITSMGEDDFIDGIIDETGPHTTDIHAGGRYADGVWSWETGEDWGFEDWGPNLPTGEALWMEIIGREDQPKFYLHWGDVEDGYCQYALIEWSADCNGDGIVDYGQILDGSLEDLNDNGVPDICDLPITIDPYEWSTDQGGNGHWYALLTIVIGPSQSAEEHFVLAESRGGHTATMASAEENEFCFSLNGGLTAFIGVRKEAGTNQGGWITGEPWDYTNWHSGEGTNSWERYANFWGDQTGGPSSQWQDTDLTPKSWSIVEWDADCNGDGIVDYGQILDGSLHDDDANGVPDCCDMGIPCATEWALEDGGNGHWYKPVELDSSSTEEDMLLYADSVGSSLASIANVAEDEFVRAIAEGVTSDTALLGGREISEGTFIWLDGTPFEYTNWDDGQPDGVNSGEYVGYYEMSDHDAWHDVAFTDTTVTHFILEWSADCNGDGNVDYGQILDGSLADDNGNGVPDCCEDTSCLCPADVTGNGTVDITDLLIVIGAWDSDYADADIDGNGVVGIADLLAVIDGWGPCP